MQRKGQKSKSGLSSSKRKGKAIPQNLLKIYGVGKFQLSSRKTPSKNKRKDLNTGSERKNTQNYDFPQFSISFMEPSSQNLGVGCERKQRGSINAKDTLKKSQLKIQLDQQLKTQRHVKICLDNYTDFILALSRTFKKLDSLSRGTINETNISNRIPQYTLNFLEKVFKKIQKDRLTITQKQFVKMCQPLLKESTNDQLMNFLNAFSEEQTILKESINLTNSSYHVLSPIQKRMVEAENVKNKKTSSEDKSSHLEQILNIICQKEKRLGKMIQSVKDRKNISSLNFLAENNSNFLLSNQKASSKLTTKLTNLSVIDQKNRQQENKKLEDKVRPFQCRQYEKENFQYHLVPSFAFHLPLKRGRDIQSKPKLYQPKQSENMKAPILDDHYSQRHNSTRLLCRGNYNLTKEAMSKTMKFNDTNQNSKIDELNRKLEQYLQRSQSKIEKSKIFLLQNSSLIL